MSMKLTFKDCPHQVRFRDFTNKFTDGSPYINVHTKAKNSLELMKDIVESTGKKDVDTSSINIIIDGSILRISEDTTIDFEQLLTSSSLIISNKK